MITTTFIDGIRTLAARYDGFLIDQWGVIHDGVRPYPDALEALAHLRVGGGRIVLLSNSGSRARINLERLRAIGIDPALVDGVITSGEVAFEALTGRGDPDFAALGKTCVHWSRGGDRSVVEGTDLDVVGAAGDASFILLTGTDDDVRLEDFQPELDQARARDLPLVCANPDVRVVGPGGVGMAPGAIAAHYEGLGGRVIWIGKPHAAVYAHARGMLPAGQVLAVGDSLAHDILGGARQGHDTAFVMEGIHAEAFEAGASPDQCRGALDRLVDAYGVRPTFALSRFRW